MSTTKEYDELVLKFMNGSSINFLASKGEEKIVGVIEPKKRGRPKGSKNRAKP